MDKGRRNYTAAERNKEWPRAYCSARKILRQHFGKMRDRPNATVSGTRFNDFPFSGWSKSKKELDKLCGVKGWTLHDLRRTYRSIHGKIGTPPHIAERLVNHISAQTEMERTYDRYAYLSEMQRGGRNLRAISATERGRLIFKPSRAAPTQWSLAMTGKAVVNFRALRNRHSLLPNPHWQLIFEAIFP